MMKKTMGNFSAIRNSYYTPVSSSLQLLFRHKCELKVVKYELCGVNAMTHDERLLLGERLRSRRSTLGHTQEYVAEKIGITLRFYQMIERGEKNLSLDTLINVAKVMSVSIDYLLFGAVAGSLENPISEILHNLSPGQREDAFQILKLYANACYQKKM